MKYLIIFKWKEYIKCNLDLKKNWDGPIRARVHYCIWGANEKRKVSNSKYICVGNSKTATTSLLKAFEILGYNFCGYNHEMICDYLSDDISKILDYSNDFYFLKDWPWRQVYKEIDKKYDNCKFIMTIRNEDNWVTSYIKSIEKDYKDLHYLIRKKFYGFNPKDFLDDKKYLIENIYRKQNQDVLYYFRDRPEDLLIIDLTKPGQWDKLCAFIGCRKPWIKFPHANKTKK